jgi:hypothetical protein
VYSYIASILSHSMQLCDVHCTRTNGDDLRAASSLSIKTTR